MPQSTENDVYTKVTSLRHPHKTTEETYVSKTPQNSPEKALSGDADLSGAMSRQQVRRLCGGLKFHAVKREPRHRHNASCDLLHRTRASGPFRLEFNNLAICAIRRLHRSRSVDGLDLNFSVTGRLPSQDKLDVRRDTVDTVSMHLNTLQVID